MYHNGGLNTIVSILRTYIVVFFLRFTATNECIQPECIGQATRLMESINYNVDPCDDFVEFACGQQFEKFEKMKDNFAVDLWEPTTYRLHLWWIRKVLQEELNKPPLSDDSRAIKLAKIFWKRCKITTQDDALASVRILLKRLGGWPIITKSWNEKQFSWDKFSKCARRLGFLPRMFIHVGLDVDYVRKIWHPNDTINLMIEKPKYKDHLIAHNGYSIYTAGYYTIAEFISDGIPPSQSDITDALNFGQQLQQLDCDQNEKKTETMSIIELQEKFPIINWFEHIKAMMRPRQAKYLSDYNCIIVDVCYVSAFAKFITKADKKLQANYAFTAIIDDLFTLIRPQLTLAFSTTQRTTEQICFDVVAAIFRKALDVIIGRAPDPTLMMKMTEVENHIYNQTLQIFHMIPWMDEITRSIARRKLNSIVFENPFPDDIFNNHYFLRLDFSSEHPLPAILRDINIFLVDNYYLQAGRTRVRYGLYQHDEQVMRAVFQESISPNVASTKPDIFTNTIYMPAASILHRQLGLRKELDFINYALVGVQFGEALSHHIYQKGAHVDAEGKWRMNSWWSKTTQNQFTNRQSCQAIGPMTPIADASMIFGLIGGVEIAYMTMFNDCVRTTCSTTLRGLQFDTRQLFWLTLVASDCDQNLKTRYNTIVSHNKNFVNDFQCPLTSKMHVRNRCTMWTH